VNIQQAIESESWDRAIQILDDAFLHNPDDPATAFYFATVMLKTEHPGPAKWILERLVEEYPDKWQGWMNLGLANDELERYDVATEMLLRVLKEQPDNQDVLTNLSCAATKSHRWDEAKMWAHRALVLGESIQAEVNLAFAHLHEGDFEKGWDLYAKGIGHMTWRERKDWAPHYEGEGRVVIYGEQGVGDQIAFLSALPDAIEQGLEVAGISCYPKLEGLFRDTFPELEVHGTHFDESPAWLNTVEFDRVMPMSWLHKFYRKTRESYTGEPYLKVNPAKKLQWQALLDAVSDKPKVGISWTGGKRGSHSWRHKSLPLDDLKEILQIDVDWVCLEYKDHSLDIARIHTEDGLLVRDWPWATQTNDYSDTAALVDCLDALVTVPTSVNHLAGALGKEVHCLIHDRPHFHYGAGMPYYNSVNLHQRNAEGVEAVKEAIEGLVRVGRLEVA